MKELLLGNKAVARALYESGCVYVSSYPGTPSTEITEFAAEFPEIYCEWAPNEKVALESALGAAVSGGRSFCAMKHVGLNVAADPLYICSYVGSNAGMVIAVADDPSMHSSQNEQDSRHYAIGAKLPMIQPADSAEALEFTKLAFDLSEKYDTPFLLRMTTRIAHSQSLVELSQREEKELKPYNKDAGKYVMMPGNAKKRHIVVEQRLKELTEFAENCPFNKVELGGDIGVICAGTEYQYAKEVFGDKASYLKLGLVNPLPEKLIRDFAAKCSKVYVVEELDPIIEDHCRKLGIEVIGKKLLPNIYEFSQELVAEKLMGEKKNFNSLSEELPMRPPVLCPGCPHRGLFYVLKKLKLTVSGDIGCYTLGAVQPLGAIDSTFCMGASISALHGMNKTGGIDSEKSVAVIGDSTFAHSGLTGLMNMTYNKSVSTVIICDNSITGMTGHQQNPTTGRTLREEDTIKIDIEAVCRALGVNDITVVDPNETDKLEEAIKAALKKKEISVIISRRPCVLLKYVAKDKRYEVKNELCRGCKKCMQLGCPAISFENGKAKIDETLCTGCGLCEKMCAFGAISLSER